VDDPEKLEAIRQREVGITRDRIEKILKSGANVILSTQVGSSCLFVQHYARFLSF
jgi:hypothetical protein